MNATARERENGEGTRAHGGEMCAALEDTLGVNPALPRARYRVEPCKFSTRKFYGMQNASSERAEIYIFGLRAETAIPSGH